MALQFRGSQPTEAKPGLTYFGLYLNGLIVKISHSTYRWATYNIKRNMKLILVTEKDKSASQFVQMGRESVAQGQRQGNPWPLFTITTAITRAQTRPMSPAWCNTEHLIKAGERQGSGVRLDLSSSGLRSCQQVCHKGCLKTSSSWKGLILLNGNHNKAITQRRKGDPDSEWVPTFPRRLPFLCF